MDLDKIYKSKLDHSHSAGLEAVFAAGHHKACEEFLDGTLNLEYIPVPPVPTAAEGETSDEEKGDATTGQSSKKGKDAKSAKDQDAAV